MKRAINLFINLIILLFIFNNLTLAESSTKTLQMRNGVLRILESGRNKIVLLNSQAIYSSEELYLHFEKYIKNLGPDDIILFVEGSSATTVGKYRFITVFKEGGYSISKEAGNGMEPKITIARGKVILNFPAWSVPGETWVYEKAKFKKMGEQHSVTPGSWQYSQAEKNNNIELWVRDKNRDERSPYEAWFIIDSPDGKVFKIPKRSPKNDGNEPIAVYFPADFKLKLSEVKTGLYKWKCIVEGGVVIEERFTYTKGKGFRALQ